MSRTLSAVIIARDEERDLPDCLASLEGLASEVVVLDGGSGDRTLEIARARGAKTASRTFDGYASQKQAALEMATGDWVLSIDADERVSAPLGAEIRALLAAGPDKDGYEIPFEVVFMGAPLRFGGPGSERHLRLFRREKARFAGGLVHEGVEVTGPVGRLRGRMIHLPYRDVSEYLSKLDAYTTYAAEKRRAAGVRPSPLHHLLPLWEFFVRVFLRLGLLDGRRGLVWAGLSSFHTWVKYVKLAEMGRSR